MCLFIDRQETLRGYFEMFRRILTKYGIPEAFYADNRSVFEFRRLSPEDQARERVSHIQFRRVCQQLDVELITTSVPQAKGRIERLWVSVQSRLTSELSLKGRRLQLACDDGSTAEVAKGATVCFYETMSGMLYAVCGGKVYMTKLAGQPKEISKPKGPGHPKWRPGPDHPLRRFVISYARGGNK